MRDQNGGDEMRITLETEEKQFGLIMKKPKWWVTCKIVFSDEELAIIRQRDLSKLEVYTQVHHNMPVDPIDRTLGEVVKHGIECSFNTPIEAKQFEQHLKEKLLPNLKNYLTVSAEPMSGSSTFEL
jgi:hypothetical protein